MPQNFKLYNEYYEPLYKDKDYVAETDYLVNLINQYSLKCKTL